MNYQNDTKVKNRSNHSHVEKSRNKFINPEVAAITAGTIVILGIVVLVAANVFCKALGQGFGHSLAGK